jgi:pimeloyl-ACP methyl ester carboxylesterase
MFVPEDYDPNQSYSMLVSLHGAGDNSKNLRNVLIESNWGIVFPNTIMAFIDGGSDPSKDFYTPVGDEEIIPTAIDFVSQAYSINNDDIILHGFSLGGRSALKYGLDHPDDFKGLLLHTPAVQGILDAQNSELLGFGFNYANASQIPIAISVGLEDGFVRSIAPAYDSLLTNNGKVVRAQVPNLGHAPPPNSLTSVMRSFIDNPYLEDIPKIDLISFELENNVVCNSLVTPTLNFRILRDELVSSILFNLINLETNEETTIQWTGESSDFELTRFELPEISLQDGPNNFQIQVLSVNGEEFDDEQEESIEIFKENLNELTESTIKESFEGNFPSDGWQYIESGKSNAFVQFSDPNATDGNNLLFTFNTLILAYDFLTIGLKDELITPTFDLVSPVNYGTKYSFDYAYFEHEYLLNNGQTTILTDTLSISISNDCGDTWIEFWRKAGEELATSDIINISTNDDIAKIFATPPSNQWRTELLDIDQVVNELNLDTGESSKFKLKFSYISGQGGSFFMDNIRLKEFLSVADNMKEIENIYPLPANDRINYSIQLENSGIYEISIYDLNGNKLITKSEFLFSGSNDLKQGLESLNSGAYFIKIEGEKESFGKKFIIE